MLDATRERLLSAIGPDDLVLDVGGWADPFERADWVLDLMPYESRGLYEREGWVPDRVAGERFGPETWIQRDVCAHEPFPFAENEIDFVVCSQTLEDLRDPVWACHEMSRIGKAGYIEVPSRLEEQSWGVNGQFVGWSHHRWLIDIEDARIDFVLKLHSIHARGDQHFPAGFWEELAPEERVQTLWWSERFDCRERIFLVAEESDRYLSEFVACELARRAEAASSVRPDAGTRPRGLRRRLGGRDSG